MPSPISESKQVASGSHVKLGFGSPLPAAPIPEFSGSPTSGNTPLSVTFTNQSTGTYSSLLYDFGDGQTSSSANPVHSYAVAGTYTVALILTWAGGTITRTRPAYITTTTVTIGVDGAKTYRDDSNLLFQATPFAEIPSRLPLGSPNSNYNFTYERWGPTHKFVDKHGDWLWRNPGGDWLDANLVSQGSTAWASTPTPTGSAGTIYDHSMDITAAMQYIQTNSRWAAFALRGSTAARKIAGQFHPDSTKRPRIEVVYADTTTATLACTLVSEITTSSTIPSTVAASVSTHTTGTANNCVIEFQRPTKAISSATMYFSCTEQQWSGSPTDIKLLGVLDPPTRSTPNYGGIAQSISVSDYDLGLDSNPNTIFLHRYTDSTLQSDVISPYFGNYYDNEFSPEIFGGAVNTNKLPYLHAGKWTQANSGVWNLNLVTSSYTGEGFVPLAPGLGAVRTHLPAKSPTVVDGDVVGVSGDGRCQARMPLPINRIGLQQHIRLRYYMRMHLESAYGPMTPQNRQHVWQTLNSAARFTDRSGKGGIGVSHDTLFGGFSGSSGGNKGWQMRDSWYLCDANMGGPSETGVAFGYHLYDFLSAQPAGHQYGGTDYGVGERYGQVGGFGGNLEFDRWYCIEKEIKLNTVTGTTYPAYIADGELRTWIDGRLVYERTGMVMRQTPVHSNPSFPPGGSFVTPMRELGIRDILMNFFYGGQTFPTESITEFFTGLVVTDGASGYIGPMKGVELSLPAWRQAMPVNTWAAVPSSTTLASLDVTGNPSITPVGADWVGRGMAAGAFAWTGYSWNDETQTWYAGMLGGHSDYGGNEPYKVDISSNSTVWQRLRLPSGALPGASLVARDGNEANGTGLYSDGRLRAHHSYHNHRYVPDVGLVVCRMTGLYYSPGGSDTRKIWTIDTTTGEATERCNYHAFTQMGNGEGSVDYDPVRKCLWTIGSATSTLVQVTGLSAPTWTAAKRGTYDNWLKPSGVMRYIPGMDVLAMFPTFSGSGFGIRNLKTFSVSYPTLTGSFSAGFIPPDGSGNQPGCGMEWSVELGCFLLWNNTSSTTEISTLTPSNMQDPTQPWVRGKLTVSGSNIISPPAAPADGVFSRMTYSPRLGCVLLHVGTDQNIYAFSTR